MLGERESSWVLRPQLNEARRWVESTSQLARIGYLPGTKIG